MIDKRQRVANVLEPESDLALQPVYTMKLFAPATILLLISYNYGTSQTQPYRVRICKRGYRDSSYYGHTSDSSRKNHAGVSRAPQSTTFL